MIWSKKNPLKAIFLAHLLLGVTVTAFSESKAASCVISFSSLVATNCNGCSPTNGSICVTITYTGVPLNNQFDLSIDNGKTWTTGTAGLSTMCKTNLPPANYWVRIRDRFGCITDFSANPVTIDYNICVPDANFKALLVGDAAINTNSDTEIQRSEALAYTGQIDVPDASIADLTGLEEFTGITQFSCIGNPAITQIDVSKNIQVDRVYCSWCSIYELDLSKNTKIKYIICNNNLLSDLDLSNNPLLASLNCANNQIDSLNLANNPLLETLNCESNLLEALDLSANHALEYLKCSDNLLNYLNLKNGNNTNITTLDCTANPDLSCVLVDSVAFSETNWAGFFDSEITFSLDCNPYPQNDTIINTSFEPGLTYCYSAYQTITVGGDGNEVDFNSLTSVTLIAGLSISFLPGVTIYEGSYMSASITSDSTFCEELITASPVVTIYKTKMVTTEINAENNASFKVYPNPNKGIFTIMLNGIELPWDVLIVNSYGQTVLKTTLNTERTIMELPNTPNGIYFITSVTPAKVKNQKFLIN